MRHASRVLCEVNSQAVSGFSNRWCFILPYRLSSRTYPLKNRFLQITTYLPHALRAGFQIEMHFTLTPGLPGGFDFKMREFTPVLVSFLEDSENFQFHITNQVKHPGQIYMFKESHAMFEEARDSANELWEENWFFDWACTLTQSKELGTILQSEEKRYLKPISSYVARRTSGSKQTNTQRRGTFAGTSWEASSSAFLYKVETPFLLISPPLHRGTVILQRGCWRHWASVRSMAENVPCEHNSARCRLWEVWRAVVQALLPAIPTVSGTMETTAQSAEILHFKSSANSGIQNCSG